MAMPSSGTPGPAGYGSASGVYDVDRGQGPRHRRLQGRPDHRGACRPGRRGEGGGPAAHPRIRQGDHGRAGVGQRPRARGAGEGRRQGLRGQPHPDAADRREGGRRVARAGRGPGGVWLLGLAGQWGLAPRGAGGQAARRGAGRPPRGGAGARRRPRRLHGGLPRRRSRQEGRAGGALALARRRLPERRLHPVEGAAARRQGDRGDARHGPCRPVLRRALHRHRQAARVEGRGGQAPDRRAGRPRQAAQGHGGRRHRPLHRAEPGRGERRRQRAGHRLLRAGDHRRGLRAGDPALHPARRSAGDRQHRRARTRRRAEAPAGHRRRHHRPGDGDGLPRARRRR